MGDSTMGMGLESTMSDYISQYNSEEITFPEFFLKQVFDVNNKKMIVNFNSLVIKYMPELESLKTKITLTNEEHAKYKYNPKLLSYDLYGTTELWFLILEANELRSITEFNSKTIYLFKTDILEKMSRILNLEQIPKDYNEEEISTALNN